MARDNKRHFPVIAGKPTVEWVGDGVQDGWHLRYREVLLNEESLNVGDCALVASNRSGDDPYVCQIIGLYEDQNKEQFATVQWFYRSDEVRATLQRLRSIKLFTDVDEEFHDAEEICAGHEDTIGIIAICGRCRIRVGNYNISTTEKCDENEIFCVNHFFDNRTGSRHPLTVVVCELDKPIRKSETQDVELSGNFRLCISESVEEMASPQSSVRSVSKYRLRSPIGKSLSSNAKEHSQVAADSQRKSLDRKRKQGSGMELPTNDGQSTSESTEESDDEVKIKKSKRKSLKQWSPARFPTRPSPCILPSNAFEEARTKLHLSALPGSLPCREDEFREMCLFIKSKLTDDCGGCLYVSGVPGSGKTATVCEVIGSLQHAVEQNELKQFQFVEVSGMKMTEPYQIYPIILKQLTGERATAHHAQELLAKFFNQPSPRQHFVVLVVDELDLLWTKKQDVMYNLFNWPTFRNSRLVVLAIANTMDLPERVMPHRVQSRLGITRLTFQPYTHSQLQEIVLTQLQDVKVYDPDAIELIARKVAAVSGDARRALDICRRAVELAQSNLPSSQHLVGLPEVDAAAREMLSSSKIIAISKLALQEKLFLRSLLSIFSKSGTEEAVLKEVWRQQTSLCRLQGITVLSIGQLSQVCDKLSSSRLLVVEPGRHGMQRRIRLNVNQDDIIFGLKDSGK